MVTLSVAYIVRDEMAFLPASLEQAEKIADEIVIVIDARSQDGTLSYISGKVDDERYKDYQRRWDTGALQKQYALEKCTKDFVLFLDGDEVLSDNCQIIKDAIQNADFDVSSIRGHHFIYSLKSEDSSKEEHLWEARLFRRLPAFAFFGKAHAILRGYEGFPNPKVNPLLKDVRIFHYGYVKHLQKIIDKFEEDLEKPQLTDHTPHFMFRWKDAHLLGTFPVKEYVGKHPEPVLKKFNIQYWDDIKYFEKRTAMEFKFFADVR